MPESESLSVRLQKGLVRIDAEVPGGWDAEALAALRRTLEHSMALLEPGKGPGAGPFRFQLTGGKPLLFLGAEALPIEPYPLSRLLESMGVLLEAGESLEVDPGLAAWMIRPEVNVIDTNLRHAEEALRSMKSGRDRDHSAAQTAESLKIRLRSRLTQLSGALEAAQRGPSEAS